MRGTPLKYLAVRPPEYGLNVTPSEYREDGVRLLRTGDINGDGALDPVGGVYLDRTNVPTEMLLEDGDILFSRSGTVGRGYMYLGEGQAEATFAGFLVRFRLKPGIDPRAARYWSESTPFQGAVEAGSISSTIANFNAEKYASLTVPAALVAHSSAIADYLDSHAVRIDDAVQALRRAMNLLAERRRSLITEVFTEPIRARRGTTIRAIADLLLGRQRSPEQATGPHMVRYLRAANVKDGRLDLDDVMEMNFSPREQATFGLRRGDILITEGAGSLNAVGANAPWTGELDGTVCFQNTLIRLRPKPATDPSYVAWWARYAHESGLFRAAATGANIYHLGVETVRGLPAWAPSAATQRDVVIRLDREVGVIEAQMELRRRQIDLLLERRQALITAAVTGQVDIPGPAA